MNTTVNSVETGTLPNRFPPSSETASRPPWLFHTVMFGIFGALCLAGSIIDPGGLKILLLLIFYFPLSLIPAIVREARGETDKFWAALSLPWSMALLLLNIWIIPVFASFRFPLSDASLATIDRHIGINVVTVAAWTARHPWILGASNVVYASLKEFLWLAVLLPPLFGKRQAAEQFVASTIISTALSIPLFMRFPAVGPWVSGGFHSNALQQATESSIFIMRAGGAPTVRGVVCLPSFHTIWAIFAARALRPFKYLRIPAAILSALIVISTIVTGWHYVIDVIAGIAVASISMTAARLITSR